MPDYLAIDWDGHEICGLEARVTKGRVQLQRGFRLAVPEEFIDQDDAQAAGQWLRGELTRLGISSRQTLLSLPREEAVVRPLELPNAPDDELPAMVRFQAAAKAAGALELQALDFLPQPPRMTDGSSQAEFEGRDVLVATMARERIEQLQDILTNAGLELVSIGISPVATAELIARAEQRAGDDPNEPTLIVARHGRRVEISLMRRQALVFTHSTQLSGEDVQRDVQAVVIEINRTSVVMERTQPGFRIAKAWVVGGEEADDPLFRALSARLKARVRQFDPLVDVDAATDVSSVDEHGSQFAGPLGMLQAKSESLLDAIDFLAPRKSQAKPQRGKQQLGMAVAAAALLFVVSYGGLWWYESGIESEITTNQDAAAVMTGGLRQLKPKIEAEVEFATWKRRSVDGYAILRELHEVMQGTSKIVLTEYRSDPALGASVARIHAVGYAKNQDDIELLFAALRKRNFGVEPKELERTEDDAEYPWAVELDLTLPLEIPQTKTAEKKSAATTKKTS